MGSMIKKIYFDLDGVLADFDYSIYMFGGFKNGECHDSEVKKTMKNTKHFFYKVPPNNLMIKCFHYFHKEDTDLDSNYKKLFDSNYDNVERTTNTIVRGY